jgi:hypothetical protein
MKFDEYDVLYEQWIWDGIYGESIIFVEAELPHMTDEALEDFVAVSPIVKAKENITISRGKNGYIFVNFNFKVLEDMEDE